jgi:Ca-activated chloride channel family protein
MAVLAVIIAGCASAPTATAGPTVTPRPTATPRNAVGILILTADTKAEWVNVVTDAFNQAEVKTASGKTVYVEVMEQGSPGDAQQAVLDGTIKPTVWSPGDMSWIEGANQVWKDRTNRLLVTAECPRIVYAATGFAMWRPMAEAMGWPDEPIGWDEVVELAADPEGWGRYGHPEWGQFKFGHAHPDHSTTGFSMLTTLAYAALDMTSGLTPELVKSEAVIQAFTQVGLNTYHYGTSTRKLMDKMADRGPAYLHAVTGSETATLKNNEVKQAKRFPYVFIFPAEGTFWSDNPFCIVEADWVSEEQREAAEIYRDYLLGPEPQDMAVTIGLRPANLDVALHDPISLDYGTDPRVSPQTVPPLEGVSGEVANAIIDVFKQTKKKATVVIVLDTSTSMAGEKIKNATEGTVNFIDHLARDDEVFVYVFSDSVHALQPAGRVGDVVESLRKTLSGLFAEGNTALYDAVCQAFEAANGLQQEDEAVGEKRLYGVVVLSDGEDTNSVKTESDMFNCLPSGEDVEGVKVFTIAYGEDADEDLLLRVANRTNGKAFVGDPTTIEYVYLAISAEQ